jgi:PKD repeat protein
MPAVKASADVISGSVPLTVNFSSSGSSDDVGITNYRWRWGDGGQQNTSSTSISHTFNVAGEYRVRVRASDADGNINDGFVTIFAGVTAPAEGSKPQSWINVGSREVTLTGTHFFSGTNSFDPNPSGSIAAYRWNFGDYLTCDDSHATPGCVATGSTPTYTFPAARNYWVSLEVEGALGATQTVGKEVYAVSSGHAPRAVALADSKEGVAPFTVNFDGNSSFDYDGTIASYDWFFGDYACTTGCGSNTATGSYTFTTPGNYMATLSVVDDDGNRHDSTVEITVNSSLKAQKANQKSVKRISREDTDRLAQRQALLRGCSLGQANACFELGKMSQEDGNRFVSRNYFKKACSKGHQAACQAVR